MIFLSRFMKAGIIFIVVTIVVYLTQQPFLWYHWLVGILAALIYYYYKSVNVEEEGREDPVVVWQQIADSVTGKKLGVETSTNVNFRSIPFSFNRAQEIRFQYKDEDLEDHSLFVDGRIDIGTNKTRLIAHEIGPSRRGDMHKYSIAPKIQGVDQALALIEKELGVNKSDIIALRTERPKEEEEPKNGGK